MSDYFNLSNISPGTLAEKYESTEQYAVGALRRKYNFGNKVHALNIAQDPFFRLVSSVGKMPTDDPVFKYTEERGMWHKRYGYVCAWGTDGATWTTDDASVTTTLIDGVGDEIYVKMKTDYKSSGNIQNIYGQSNNAIAVGATGTQPIFYIPGQQIKVNTHTEADAATVALGWNADDYFVGHIESVDLTSDSTAAILHLTIVRPVGTATNNELSGWVDNACPSTVYDKVIHSVLEKGRSYIVGTGYAEGSGYGETWKDQPYSTDYGFTQIWKTAMAMTNTARATRMRYEPNEWARIWKQHLIAHKWDIEQSLLFGAQNSTGGINYTQGAVDYVLNRGNLFSWTTAKTADDFLEDMSNYCDPRYNNLKQSAFMVSTDVYNWMYKLGGYFKGNLELSDNFRADLAIAGRKKVLGLDSTVIKTIYGDINMVRNIHLDGTNVKMLGVDLGSCKYRPLVGNGMNRDTSVYVGVQTLENSGVDRRVDLILTEAGMQWMKPEAHAVWTG